MSVQTEIEGIRQQGVGVAQFQDRSNSTSDESAPDSVNPGMLILEEVVFDASEPLPYSCDFDPAANSAIRLLASFAASTPEPRESIREIMEHLLAEIDAIRKAS